MCNAIPAGEAGNLATPQYSITSANQLVSSYQDLYIHYFPILYQIALGLGLPDEDAQDIAHDTLMEAYKKLNISGSQPNGSLEAELIQILYDLLIKFRH